MNKSTIAITLAAKHLDNGAAMASSARLCHDDAVKLAERGEERYAVKRALDSLAYSVGILSTDHAAVKSLLA